MEAKACVSSDFPAIVLLIILFRCQHVERRSCPTCKSKYRCYVLDFRTGVVTKPWYLRPCLSAGTLLGPQLDRGRYDARWRVCCVQFEFDRPQKSNSQRYRSYMDPLFLQVPAGRSTCVPFSTFKEPT